VPLPLSAKLHEALNNGDMFLDVMNAAEKQYFVAKRDICKVELVEVPKASQMNLQRRATDRDRFNPYEVLGVQQGTDADAIRQAYHAMVKAYHPDRFAGIDMPKEMKDYAAAMVVRINLAYEQLGG
jgi:DnaJ-class molecular chaperone